MVISSGTSNASISTVSFRLRRMEYSTRIFASLSNRASCIGAYHSISRAVCNSSGVTRFGQVSLLKRHQKRRERAANIFLLPSASSISPRGYDEQRVRFLPRRDCMCCKQGHHSPSTLQAQRAHSRAAESAYAGHSPELVSNAHLRGDASRRCCCTAHQLGCDRMAPPKQFLLEDDRVSNRDQQDE